MEISRRTHRSGGDDRPHTQGEWTQKGIDDDNKDNVKADAKEMTITETTFAKRPEFLNSLNTSLIGTINNELAYDVDQIRLRWRVHQ